AHGGAHLVSATMGPVKQAMSDAGLKPADLGRVLLVGGSTRIPAVQAAVRKFTGKDPSKDINPDECVAMGAALQGGVMLGEVKGLLLLDVTPLSLGIETMGDVFSRIIDRNTTLPVQRSQVFTTAASFQTSVDIHVLQGEREIASCNKTLGRFRLGGIRRAPRGVPQIEVTFSIDANGIVHVSAKDLGTGKFQEIALTQSSNMSSAEIDQAVRDAERYAGEDALRKQSAEDKERIEALRKRVKKAMDDHQEEELKAACDELTTALQGVGRFVDEHDETGSEDGAMDADFSAPNDKNNDE
ncbi:MAG: Hsp70 family protein, partial [Clostridia bacterium]